ncbi:MAG: phosphatase PAP2 family protein [Candidatus Paceibacterota bacterium]
MNQVIFQYLNNLAGGSQGFDNLVIFCAEWLPYVLIAVFLVLLIFGKKTYREKIKIFIFAALSVFLSRIIITEIIRYFYPVSRPFVNNIVHQLIFHETSSSFPSGHATFFFALAMAVMLATRWRTWGAVFFTGAVLISLARVVAGIHWPYDILAGAVVGVFSALVFWVLKKISNGV